ncbi:MAG TPA: amidohydrolase family protein [Alphaproteobacteria bacterium]|nr:amidohydrolase family protein [Alphaproteobacteria bacterium]
MFDRIIKGGTIVDGTGAPGFTGDVAIRDGKIVEIGKIFGAARETIDADGLLVAPGWIDVHTHYDGQVTWDPLLTPSFWHGVTSVVMGNCGVGFAPVRPGKESWLIGLMEGVEDIPGAALSEGMKWSWESFPEYLDALERMPHAIDVATQLPHGALRAYVMGERGAKNQTATEDDLMEMRRLASEALKAGAFGISTSRTLAHRAIDGEPVPGTFAAEAELRTLAGAVAEHGRGVLEIAPTGVIGEDLLAPAKEIDWMARLSNETGCPMTYVLVQVSAKRDMWREQLALTGARRAEGARVTPQVGLRGVGILLGLRSRFGPFMLSPSMKALADLPFAEKVARLKSDAALRARIAGEGLGGPERAPTHLNGIIQSIFNDGPWSRIYPMWGNYEPGPDDTIEAEAARRGLDPRALVLDIMLERDGEGLIWVPVQNYSDGCLDPEYEMITNPDTIVGISDGGAHCGAIVDASAPTLMLTHWVRDRTRGPRLPLEFAVRRQTSDLARFYGFPDRGRIAPGLKADINLIDFANLKLDLPFMTSDLPTGANRLMQTAQGYVATLVAGQIVQRNGKETGARPGRLVRGGRG